MTGRAMAMLLLPGFAHAGGDKLSGALPAGPVGSSDVVSLILSLLVVVAAILAVGWIYSRVQGGRTAAGDAINIIASRPIGPKERILVIEVAGKQLLVGMTASQVQTLHVFDAPAIEPVSAETGAGFADRLRSAIRGAGK